MLVLGSCADHAFLSAFSSELDVSALAWRRAGLVGAMITVVVAVALLAYWDAERESAAALSDFAQEQATLAAALGSMLRAVGPAALPAREGEVLGELRAIERERSLAILVRPPGAPALRTTSGHEVTSARLLDGLRDGQAFVRIPREEAAAFGLPARTALAGLFRVDGGARGSWDVVAVASAERERDREARTHRRLVLSVVAAAGLVLAFGGVAMRLQRHELVLARELAIAELARARDERLERANRAAAMGTLAMGVAHEISTPLGIIAARAEQILPGVERDERLAGGVRSILAQTDGIKGIIRGLLGLARGDAPAATRLEARALVDAAVALVEHRFDEAGVALTTRVEDGLPPLLGDARLLEHAIVNLLLNACDACADGGDVVVSARRDGDVVQLAVTDSGSGISPAVIDRAREPFFTTKAREGGTGLGLALAHEIVASHRGELTFEAHAPRGTRAAIQLPVAEEPAGG